MVNLVLAHGVGDSSLESAAHSGLGNAIFSLVIGVGLIYMMIRSTIRAGKKNGSK